MTLEQIATITFGVSLIVYGVRRYVQPALALAERTARAAERSATANELTALYTRELCWRAHHADQARAGGEPARWSDPAEVYSAAFGILQDADMRAEVRRLRDEINGYHAAKRGAAEPEPAGNVASLASRRRKRG
jgi:hypothetical protein